MKTGEFATPGSDCGSACPTARANEDHIAGADTNSALLFPCIQILWINGRAWFEIGNVLQRRNIDQNTARKNPLLQILNPKLSSALGCNVCLGKIVVHFAPVEHMAE